MGKMRLEKFDKVVLFGGGPLLPAFCDILRARGIMSAVFAVDRHMDEEVEPGVTLEQALRARQVPHYRENDINLAPALAAEAGPRAIGIGIGENYTFTSATLAHFGRRVFDFMIIRLPRYRGGAHFTWQILQGNRIAAWNIQMVDEHMVPAQHDAGEILHTHEFTIPPYARRPVDYGAIYNSEATRLLVEFLDLVDRGHEFRPAPAQESFSMLFPRLYTPVHGLVDWRWGLEELERFICAFDEPFVGSQTFLNGERVHLKGASIDRGEGNFHPFMAGLVYRVRGGAAYVATHGGTLIIESVRDSGGRDLMPALRPGMRFHTPQEQLDRALGTSIEFTPEGPRETSK
jgi:hypothetical protein